MLREGFIYSFLIGNLEDSYFGSLFGKLDLVDNLIDNLVDNSVDNLNLHCKRVYKSKVDKMVDYTVCMAQN